MHAVVALEPMYGHRPCKGQPAELTCTFWCRSSSAWACRRSARSCSRTSAPRSAPPNIEPGVKQSLSDELCILPVVIMLVLALTDHVVSAVCRRVVAMPHCRVVRVWTRPCRPRWCVRAHVYASAYLGNVLQRKQSDGQLALDQPLLRLAVGVTGVVDEARYVALQPARQPTPTPFTTTSAYRLIRHILLKHARLPPLDACTSTDERMPPSTCTFWHHARTLRHASMTSPLPMFMK